MKKLYFILTMLLVLTIFQANSFAADSCGSCPSAAVCESAKSGDSCSSAAPEAAKTQPAAAAAKTGEVNLEAGKNIDAKNITATARRGAKTFIIKLSGKKETLEAVSAAFAKKFALSENKGADTELVKVAAGLWIKITNGAEAEKLEYLKSLGIKAEEEKK